MKAKRSDSNTSSKDRVSNLFGTRLSSVSWGSDGSSAFFGEATSTFIEEATSSENTTVSTAPPPPPLPPPPPPPALPPALPLPPPTITTTGAVSPRRRPSFQLQSSGLGHQWHNPSIVSSAPRPPSIDQPPTPDIHDTTANGNLSPQSDSSNGNGDHTPTRTAQYRTATPVEEFVAKYSVIKCSWRGKYERIFALAPTRFCTIDPKDFEVTNTWSLSGLLDIQLDPTDAEALTLSLRGTKKDQQLKLRCPYRAHLVSDLLAQKELFTQKLQRFHHAQSFICEKLSRSDLWVQCFLEIAVDGVICRSQEGHIRSKYLFVRMSQVGLLADSPTGFAWYDGQRIKIFFSDQRSQLLHQLLETAKKLGLFQLQTKHHYPLDQLRQTRMDATKEVGDPFVMFETKKHTSKYQNPVERLLSLHQKHMVEIDLNGHVVSCRAYNQIFCLVRSQRKAKEFEIQFFDGQSRKYLCDDRDGVLAAIYDLCVTCNENPALCINAVSNGKGVKLNPLFVKDIVIKPSLVMEECSIGTYFLLRMAAVGEYATASARRSAVAGDRGFVAIVAEFNANVPASGIGYNTKAAMIVDALRPLGSQLYYVSKSKPFASVMAVTLVQALYRIASSYHGFREIAQVHQISDSITNLLINGDELTIFWTAELLTKLTCHVPGEAARASPSLRQDLSAQEEIESYNKKLLFTNTYLVQSLVELLDGIEWKSPSRVARKGETTHWRRRRIGPLIIMGTLQTLECALCSHKHTTGRAELKMIVSLVTKYHSTLLSVLFRSRCATTVEACTLLMKTILEECEPDVAWSIKEAALMEGIVLRHFFQAVFDASFDQRCVSRYLISLWMSHFEPARKLLRRMVPNGFLSSLRAPPLCASELAELDELERVAMTSSTSQNNCPSLSERFLIVPSDQDSISPSFASTSSAIRSFSQEMAALESSSSSSSVLLYEPPQALIENKYTKARMLQKLQESDVVSPETSMSFAENHPNLTSLAHDGRRVRKRDIALHFVTSAVSKLKQDPPRDPRPIRSGSSGSISRSRAHSREHTPLTSPSSMHRKVENFRLLFYLLSKNHEQVDLIWNDATRDELFHCLSAEIQCLAQHRSGGHVKSMWNYEDFRVVYTTLEHELVVGNLYPRILCSLMASTVTRSSGRSESEIDAVADRTSSSETTTTTTATTLVLGEDDYRILPKDFVAVKDPQSFLNALYLRILRENIGVEYRDELECTLQCLQCISIVSSTHPKHCSFKEMEYFITLLKDTSHAVVLEQLVRAIRSLVILPANAKRLVEKDENLEPLVQVLLLGHAVKRYPAPPVQDADADALVSSAASCCFWLLQSVDGSRSGPFPMTRLKEMRGSIESCTFLRLPGCVSTSSSRPKSFTVTDNVQLRWELAIKGEIHPLQLAHDAASILLDIAHSNSLLERFVTRDSNDIVSSKTCLLPTSSAKKLLWRFMPQLVTLLVRFESPALCEKVVNLLEFLYRESDGTVLPLDSARSKMFSAGLFYFCFVFQSATNSSLARLLKSVHLGQDGMQDQSALNGILPKAMIHFLSDCSSADEFATLLGGHETSPKLYWNASMLDHLRHVCRAHVQSFADELEQDMFTEWVPVPMAPVEYAELADEVWCGAVYLGAFCQQEHQDFVIDHPLEFMESLRKKWQQEVSRSKSHVTRQEALQRLGLETSDDALDLFTVRAAYKQQAQAIVLNDELTLQAIEQRMNDLNEHYRVVTAPRPSLCEAGHDPRNMLLILNALTTMCVRYPGALGDYVFSGYDLLLALLVSHCSAAGNVPTFTTTTQQEEIAAKAAEFLFLSCDVSQANSEILLQQDLAALEMVLNFCMTCMVDAPNTCNVSHVSQVCLYLVQTLAILVDSWAGKQWIGANARIILDLVQLLWFWNNQELHQRSFVLFQVVDQILVIFAHMAQLETNQDLLLDHGVLWQLTVLFAKEYDSQMDQQQVHSRLFVDGEMIRNSEVTTLDSAIQNYLAVRSILVLCRLGGFYAEHSKQSIMTPRNEPLHVVVDVMMTPSLAALLVLENHHEFLKLFHSDCESYTLFWSEPMRQELLNLVVPKAQIRPVAGMRETYEEVVRFRFEYLGKVLIVGGLYITTLMDSMLALGQNPNMIPEGELGLTEQFFEELFRFIATCKLQQPKWMRDDGEELLPPFAGWQIPVEELCASHRHTCLICLDAISCVVPTLVEENLMKQEWALRMLFRFLFPPDNEVNTQQNTDEEPELPMALYVPCRTNCVHVLDALAGLKEFAFSACKYELCEILIEVIHLCPDEKLGPRLLGIIYKLCASGARVQVVKNLLESGSYLEFIAWLLITDDDNDNISATLRVPSARILSEMAKTHALLGKECHTAFCRFFPIAMVREIVARPDTSVAFIMEDHARPELIWNQDYRLHLRTQVATFMAAYNEWLATSDEQAPNIVATFYVDYSEVNASPHVGGVYLQLYLANPTYQLEDPGYFAFRLFDQLEALCGQLIRVTNTARASFSPDDDVVAQRDNELLYLVTSCLVCVLRVNPWLLHQVGDSNYPTSCCTLLQECVHSRACESLVINLTRVLRVLANSKHCIASLQHCTNALLSCLMGQLAPSTGKLRHETAYILELIRRLVFNYPDHGEKDSNTGIVMLATQVDLFKFLLNYLDGVTSLESVREPAVARSTAIEILHILELDRFQSYLAHSVLKKHKKWEKKYKYEVTRPVTSTVEDPFLVGHSPHADRLIQEFVLARGSSTVHAPATMTTAPHASSLQHGHASSARARPGSPRNIVVASTASRDSSPREVKKQHRDYKRLFK